MDIPVGTVCTIVNGTGNVYEEFIGKECTIVEGLHLQLCHNKKGDKKERVTYTVNIQGFGDKPFAAHHEELKIKKFPGQLQSWLNEKMNDLLTPKNIVLEGV